MKFGVDFEKPGDGGDVNRFNRVLLKKKAVLLKEGENKWGVFDRVKSSGRL